MSKTHNEASQREQKPKRQRPRDAKRLRLMEASQPRPSEFPQRVDDVYYKRLG